MKHPDTSTVKMTTLALAIGLGLGSAATFAQQSQGGVTHPATQQNQSSQLQQNGPASSQTPQQNRTAQNGKQVFDKLAQQHSDISKFVEAVKAAGMENSLADGTDYTVFAPTNKALESKPGESLNELMKPQNRRQLVSMLRAHIVAANVDPQKAQKLHAVETIDGGTVHLRSTNGNLMIGDAKVVDKQGIDMHNLRIYPIDNVLASNAGKGSQRLRPGSSSKSRNSRSGSSSG